MDFETMQSEVRTKLDEASANFWSDDDIQDALNEGLMELSDATEWYERMTNIPLWSERSYLDVRELLSDTFLAPKRCVNTVTGQWLDPTNVRNLDSGYARWENTTGEVQKFFHRGIWWLGWYPKPPDDTGRACLYYSALPPAMSDDTDEPEFPEEYHMGIVAYAVYELLCQDAETEKALKWWIEYMTYETELRKHVSGRIEKDRVGQLGD